MQWHANRCNEQTCYHRDGDSGSTTDRYQVSTSYQEAPPLQNRIDSYTSLKNVRARADERLSPHAAYLTFPIPNAPASGSVKRCCTSLPQVLASLSVPAA